MKHNLVLLSVFVGFFLCLLPFLKIPGPNFDTGFPMEASNSRARFVQTEAIVENRSIYLTLDQAKLSSPDVVYYKNNYLSVFMPIISFLAIPFYLLGKSSGHIQEITFLLNTVISIITSLVIYGLCRQQKISVWPSLLSAFVYLFATNALSYATTLTQHPFTALVVLLSLLNVLSKNSRVLKATIAGYLTGLAVMSDVPNILMLIPSLYYLFSEFITYKNQSNRIDINLKKSIIFVLIGGLPWLLSFFWFNGLTTGSVLKVPQFIGRSLNLENPEILSTSAPKIGPFSPTHLPLNTRNLPRGLYILLFSSERSWLFYSPILLLGVLGLILAKQRLMLFTTGVVILVYSLFGDPWGGWSFGPRYLIPAAAIASVGVGCLVERFRKNTICMILVFLVTLFSIAISVSGALTTNLNPPKVEAIKLDTYIDYTFKRNFLLIFKNNFSHTFSYNYVKSINQNLTVSQFYLLYLLFIFLFAALIFTKARQPNHDN